MVYGMLFSVWWWLMLSNKISDFWPWQAWIRPVGRGLVLGNVRKSHYVQPVIWWRCGMGEIGLSLLLFNRSVQIVVWHLWCWDLFYVIHVYIRFHVIFVSCNCIMKCIFVWTQVVNKLLLLMYHEADHCLKWPYIFWSRSGEGAVMLWTSCGDMHDDYIPRHCCFHNSVWNFDAIYIAFSSIP